MSDSTPSWRVNIAYRTTGGTEGMQTFIVHASGPLTALRAAWAEARTPQAASSRKHAPLVMRIRNLKATRL